MQQVEASRRCRRAAGLSVIFEGMARRCFSSLRFRATGVCPHVLCSALCLLPLSKKKKRSKWPCKTQAGFQCKAAPKPLEMCDKDAPILSRLFFFLFVCPERMFSTPPSRPPTHPNWVTINGPIVKVSGCSSSSQGLQTQIEGEGEKKTNGS